MKLKTVYRITTFVPEADLERLVAGILKVSPLLYGRYDQVIWWSAPGIEHFRPLACDREHVIHEYRSIKVEFAIPCDEQLLERMLGEGIAANHPWEEPVVYVNEAISPRISADEDDPA